MKKRLDIMMVEQGLAPSREKAKAYIMAGEVYVNGQKEDKAGSMFAETAKLEVRGKTLPYVSRGGLKLEKAMKNFGVTLKDKVCMDVGASTQTVCFRTERLKFILLMWDTASWTGNSEMIQELYVWKRQTSVM